jgi:thioredoxin-dependent peroxiredoxin
MLPVGSRAPEFEALDQDDRIRTLAEYLNSGPLLLYFYPADFTPGCTREACGVRDIHPQLARVGLTLVGISPQPPDSHRRFRERYSLPFTLLADPDKRIIRDYRADGPLGLGVRRVTYLIGPDGIISGAVTADFRITRHTDFVRAAITAATAAGTPRG